MLMGYLFWLLRIIEVFLMVQPASTDRKKEAKQSKAKQSKAQESKAKQSKVKQSMQNLEELARDQGTGNSRLQYSIKGCS